MYIYIIQLMRRRFPIATHISLHPIRSRASSELVTAGLGPTRLTSSSCDWSSAWTLPRLNSMQIHEIRLRAINCSHRFMHIFNIFFKVGGAEGEKVALL